MSTDAAECLGELKLRLNGVLDGICWVMGRDFIGGVRCLVPTYPRARYLLLRADDTEGCDVAILWLHCMYLYMAAGMRCLSLKSQQL